MTFVPGARVTAAFQLVFPVASVHAPAPPALETEQNTPATATLSAAAPRTVNTGLLLANCNPAAGVVMVRVGSCTSANVTVSTRLDAMSSGPALLVESTVPPFTCTSQLLSTQPAPGVAVSV